MYYGNIKDCDIANGLGIRVSLFVSGCRNHCPGCFSTNTWNFEYGTQFTFETASKLMEMLDRSYINGITILGGEPLEPENQQEVYYIMKLINEKFPQKNIWLYTGFTWEELHDPNSRANTDIINNLLSHVDVLVDGKFINDLKDISLKFRGSSNQRIINVKETLKNKELILLNI